MAARQLAYSRVILVVDDEPGVLQLIARALLHEGFSVHTAASGPDALDLAAALPARVDLVVSDLRMAPMDGTALAAGLVARGLATRFLFVSGFGTEGYDPTLGPLLHKPFTLEVLMREVTRLLH